MTSSPTTVGVYGASGYTGKLVAAELLRRGHDVVLSGRSRPRLEAAARALDPAKSDRVSIVAAGIDDAAALRTAFAPLDALVNCAGPFVRFGEPVVSAAVDTATPYIDTTGEQPWMKWVVDRFDAPARDAGIAVVTAMGFDYVPGDLLAALVGRGLEPLDEMVLAYAMSGFEATRGTMRSALEQLGGEEVVYEEGAWRPAPRFGPLRARFTYPAPIGRQPVARYPAGEVVTVPRHLRVRKVTTFITASTFAPAPWLAPAVPLLAPLGGLALRSPLRSALDRAIGRLPEGPGEDERGGARFTIVCTARGEDGGEARGVLRGSDVYGITGVMAAYGATLLARGEALGNVGALAPAAAFDAEAFLAELAPHGISVELNGAPLGGPVAAL